MLAKRRKLSARNDWLSLEPTRPLRLEFPAGTADSSVGRRRKIKAVKRSAHRAVQRPIFSPVFRGPLGNNDIFMSGALPSSPHEPIQIKVGTSAFGSPHRARPKSSASIRSSIGHATAVSCLSEELMLLGADGDYFDATQVEVPILKQTLHRSTTDQQLAVASGSRTESSCGREYGGGTANVNPLQGEYKGMTQSEKVACREDRYSAATFQSSIESRSSPEVTRQSPHLYRPDAKSSKQENSTINQIRHPTHNDRKDIAMGSGDQYDVDPDSESIWRRLMGVRTPGENATSTRVVNPTGTYSGTSDRALLSISHRLVDGQNYVRHSSWQHAMIDPCHEHNAFSHAQHQPLLAPSQVPLRQPECALPENQNRSKIDDAESLWREFITGSPNTEDDNGFPISSECIPTGATHFVQPAPLIINDFGASDRATQGDPVISGSPETPQYLSHVGTDAAAKDIDSIDDLSIDDETEHRSPRNIHTMPGAVTGVRGFKPRDRQPAYIEHGNRNQPSKRFVRSRALR